MLMHSEFNANNKHDGRAMMKNGEEMKSINQQQYGGRKDHQCNRAVVTKQLICDLFTLQVLAACWLSNDAKSCYDRIVHSVAFLAMARQGLPYTALKSMFLTLQNAVHHVKTAFGVSKQAYGGKLRRKGTLPFHGIGQGNGLASACWDAISTISFPS